MWCPKCKNEYVPGVTKCVDCGVDLVESLEEYEAAEEQATQAVLDKMYESFEENISDCSEADSEEEVAPIAPTHAYVSKKSKTEDIKSTAYTFTFVGFFGIILLILFATGVLPIHTADYMKVIISIVMGCLFIIFLGIGIRSFQQLKTVTEEADTEEKLLSAATEWFRTTFDQATLDTDLDTEKPEELLYFARYEKMQALLRSQYPDIDESLLDYIIETLYGEIF